MCHIIEGSARNSPQTVPVEEANRKGKAVTEGNKLQDYFCQRRERIRGKLDYHEGQQYKALSPLAFQIC